MISMHLGAYWRKMASVFLVLAAVMFLSGFLAGCSAVKQGARKINPISSPKGELRKRVGVVAFDNLTPYGGAELAEKFRELTVAQIQKEDSSLIPVLLQSGEWPRGGYVSIANHAERLGLSAVVFAAISGMSTQIEETGMLWFRGSSEFLHIEVLAAVLDPETSAKLVEVSREFTLEIEPTYDDEDNIQAKSEPPATAIAELIAEAAEEVGESLGERLEDQPWLGFLAPSEEGSLVVAAGRRMGVKENMRLDLYERGESTPGLQGARFFMPGIKYATLRITSVDEQTSMAVLESGGPVKPHTMLKIAD